jgi:hypothetical protein
VADNAKEERASIRRVNKLIDWLCDEPMEPSTDPL